MKYLTIKRDKPFIDLVFLLSRSPDLLINEILNNAYKGEYITDMTEYYAGSLLIDFFTEIDIFTKDCLGSHDKKVVELFSQLTLWGFGDCPECGCELESEFETTIGDYIRLIEPRIIKEKIKCTNCNYVDEK